MSRQKWFFIALALYNFLAPTPSDSLVTFKQKLKVYKILILKVMPFLPPPALSVDASQGRDSKKEKNPTKKEKLLKTQI
jgi:hypothetical protein